VIELFEQKGATVDYSDPFVAKTYKVRRHDLQMESVALTPDNIAKYDVVVVVTDHTNVDYALVAKHAKLVVDTRNALKKVGERANILKA